MKARIAVWVVVILLVGLPVHAEAGDANGDGLVSVADVFYLINSLFAGGAAPVRHTTFVSYDVEQGGSSTEGSRFDIHFPDGALIVSATAAIHAVNPLMFPNECSEENWSIHFNASHTGLGTTGTPVPVAPNIAQQFMIPINTLLNPPAGSPYVIVPLAVSNPDVAIDNRLFTYRLSAWNAGLRDATGNQVPCYRLGWATVVFELQE